MKELINVGFVDKFSTAEDYLQKSEQCPKIDKKINILILINDHPTILFNNLISPDKLIGGGAAILHDLNKNHHKAILGIKFINPLLINKRWKIKVN